MAISYINTAEVEDISKDIIALANDFNSEINDLFTRFSEVPTITREWVGNQAQFYFNSVAQDKVTYTNFASKLKEIGFKLSSDIYEVQTTIKNNGVQEMQKGS